jgi:hypothetical protein
MDGTAFGLDWAAVAGLLRSRNAAGFDAVMLEKLLCEVEAGMMEGVAEKKGDGE